jgi:hypothetical protein
MDKSGTFMETQVKQILLQETLFLSFLGMFCTLFCLYHYYPAVPCFNFVLSLTCILRFSFFKCGFLPCFCLYHIQLFLSSLSICALLLFFPSRYDLYLALSLSLPSCTLLFFWSVLDLYFASLFSLQMWSDKCCSLAHLNKSVLFAILWLMMWYEWNHDHNKRPGIIKCEAVGEGGGRGGGSHIWPQRGFIPENDCWKMISKKSQCYPYIQIFWSSFA